MGYSHKSIIKAYQATGSGLEAAKLIGCSFALVYYVLKNAGIGRKSSVKVITLKGDRRKCRVCGAVKSVVEFERKGTTNRCKECLAKYNVDYGRLRRYGLTPDQYEALIKKQRGLCAICGKAPEKFHVDHDHESGKVRGLLCGRCNHYIGYFETSTKRLKAALKYLSLAV